MADIFQEVQEDLRRDRAKALWDRYGWFVVAIAAVIVAVVGGWRGYEYFQAKAAADAGDRYQAASKLARDGKSEEARAAFEKLAAEAPGGYPALARMRAADETAKTDKAAALKLYQSIADDGASDPMLRDAARLRAGYLAVDTGSLADVRRLVEPIAVEGPWQPLAREAIGLAAYKAGDGAEARKQFEAIVADPGAPGSARQRANLLLDVLPPADAGPAKGK